MSDTTLAAALRALRKLAAAGPSDAVLLGRLARHRDRAAFEELVRRHGPLVWRVCRRLLPDPCRAEDAFQSAFLLLARKAPSIRRPASVAAWLHGAAYRLASRARADLRRAPASLVAEPTGPAPDPAREAAWRELGALVEAAVAALPERLRLPVLLCYWEGLTNEEAARRLGWPAGTVKGRLARARRALHRRLTAQGVTLPAGVAALLLVPSADAALPAGLATATSRRAAALWTGVPARGALAGAAWKWQLAAVLALAVGAGGWAAAVLASRAAPEAPPPAVKAADRGPPVTRPAGPGTDRFGDPLPPGAVVRLGTVGLRLPDAAGVGFRPTGELVGLSANLALHVWPADASSGPRVIALPGGRQYGWRRALSPDARFAAGLLPHRLVVWDVSGARPTECTSRAVNDVYTMAFSRNGAWLAVNESDGRGGALVLCNLAARTWSQLPVNLRYADSLSFTPDGKWLTVTADMNVLVVETATGKVRCRKSFTKIRPGFAALSPDGATLAVLPINFIHHPTPVVRLLAVPSGEEVAGLKPPTGPGRWVGFSPDGKRLLVGGPRGIREWDPVAGKLVREIAGPAESPAVYSADGRRLAAHGTSAVLLWDVARGRHVRPDLAGGGHTEAIIGVTLSPDGRLIATNALDGEVRVWAADTGRPLCRAAASWGGGSRVAFLPDSKAFVAVAEDYVTPVVLDALTGRELRRFEVPPAMARSDMTHDLRLTEGGKVLTTVSHPTNAREKLHNVRWDVSSGRLLGRAERSAELGGVRELPPVAVSPDGGWMVKMGTLSRVGGGEPVQLVPAGEAALMQPARFSDDGRRVAAPRQPRGPGGEDRASVVVYDLAARARLAELPTGEVLRVAFSPDGRRVAVGGRKEVVVWEVLTGKPARRLPARHRGTIYRGAIACTPDGRRLVNGEGDCTALVWDLTGTGRAGGAPAPPLTAAALAGLWEDLAGADPGRADTAGWELADRSAQAVPVIRERVKPVRAADGAEVRALVARLDGAAFADRQAAEAGLRALGEAAVPALREARAGGLSVEQKRSVGRILAAAAAPTQPAGERLRELRAVVVLERAGTAGAREALAELAAGLAEARLTREAKGALRRLAGRRRP